MMVSDATQVETHANLAVAYHEMGLHEDAIANAVAAIACDPEYAHMVGYLVLDALSPLGWERFRTGLTVH